MFAHKKNLAENYSFFFEKKEKKGNFAAANIGEKPESPQLNILLTNKKKKKKKKDYSSHSCLLYLVW